MEPILIGAGVGALTSAATGQNPFTGALLGGATGGVFGGSESLLGGKIAGAFGQGAAGGASKGITAATGELAKQAIPSVGIQGLGQSVASNIDKIPLGQLDDFAGAFNVGQSSLGSGIPISAGDLAGGAGNNVLGANVSQLFNYVPPTALEKLQGVGTDAYSWAKDNPLSAGNIGLKGVELANQPPKPVDTSGQRPVKQGSFEGGAGIQMPTPAATGVSPRILPAQPNKTGQIALDSVVQRHPELIELYPNLFGGR
jgi:hypothetical protein